MIDAGAALVGARGVGGEDTAGWSVDEVTELMATDGVDVTPATDVQPESSDETTTNHPNTRILTN